MLEQVGKFIFISLIVILKTSSVLGAIDLNKIDTRFRIGIDQMDQYIDLNSNLTINDFVDRRYLFDQPEQKLRGTRKSDVTYWIAIDIESVTNDDLKYIFECSDSRISMIEAFINDTPLGTKPAGTLFPFSNRSYHHKSFVYRLPKLEKYTLILKIQSFRSTQFNFHINEELSFLRREAIGSNLIGSAHGILFFAFGISLLQLMLHKESIYLAYALASFSILVASLYLDGTGFQFLWPNHPGLNHALALAIPLLVIAAMSLLVIFLFELYKKRDLHFKLITGSALLAPIGALFCQFGHHFYIHNIIYLLPFLAILYITISKYRAGFKPALYFLIGYIFILVSVSFYLLEPLLPLAFQVPITKYSVHLSSIILIIAISYAQYIKFSVLSEARMKSRKETIFKLEELSAIKDRINEQIEEKVAFQTKELEKKNSIIHQQNAKLLQANDKLKEYTDEIILLNLNLDQENEDLKSSMQKVTESRIFQNSVPFEEFREFFNRDEACFKVLEELKWSAGYTCSKCDNTKYGKGKGPLARRCTKCGANESVTSNTIFHRIHFPIQKAFYILFLVNRHGDRLISKDLSEIVDLRLATCWKFAKTIKQKKQSIEASGKTIDSWMKLI